MKIIELDIVTRETIKMEDLTPREKSIYDAGVEYGSRGTPILAVIMVVVVLIIISFSIHLHMVSEHGTGLFDY